MDYVFEMARTLREDEGLPLTLLIEKTSPVVTPSWSIVQRFSTPVLRVLENFYLIARERAQGTKIFYVHYSFVSAISAGIITRLFGGTTYYWNAGMPWQYKRPWLQERYERLAFKLIHHLVTGATAIVPGYCTLYGLKPNSVIMIPNWIDLQHIHKDIRYRDAVREELEIPSDSKLLLFVHKLSKRKGAHLLPEIMTSLTDSNIHLVVAGDGPLMTEIQQQIVACNLVGRIHLLGSVTRARVAQLYQAADIFLLPSEEEGSPHSLIEAMAYGLPFVAFDVGGVKETATSTLENLIVPKKDIVAMVAKITALFASREYYEQIQQLAQSGVKRYDKVLIQAQFRALFTGHITNE